MAADPTDSCDVRDGVQYEFSGTGRAKVTGIFSWGPDTPSIRNAGGDLKDEPLQKWELAKNKRF
jgi:hypothetical protein